LGSGRVEPSVSASVRQLRCRPRNGTIRSDPFLCDDCVDLLAAAPWIGCSRCGAAVPTGASVAGPCSRCRGRHLRFDSVVALGLYRDQLRSAVLKMKRPSGEPLAYAIGQLFHLRRREVLAELCPDWVAPVPMHWIRRAVRKTNSPELLAGQIARGLGAGCAAGILRRVRNTRPQPGLAPADRFQERTRSICGR